MKIGVQFFVTGYTIDPVTLATTLEDAGFESFWAPDHVVLPLESATPYPMSGGATPAVYGQMAEPFVLLGVMSGVTRRLCLGTGIAVVPERHPLLMAKTVGTLDNFSGGRLLLGVGTGWMREEVELFGTLFEDRWTYTREAVEAMRALWRDGAASYEGELVRFPKVACDPLPCQRPGPPVILGVQPTPAGIRRIAAWADGWIVMGATPDVVAAGRKAIDEECRRIGRDPAEIEISVGARDPSPAMQRAYEDAGASRLIVGLYNHTGEAVAPERWTDATVTALTSPPPSPSDTLRAIESIHCLAGL